MSVRVAPTGGAISERYEARLARTILDGAANAPAAAMELLEHCEPPTRDAAVALIADHGTITVGAFDCLVDAWETYRHLRHLSWD